MERKTKRFLGQYYHDGAWWALDITACDFEDAESRAKKLGHFQLLGEHKMTIRAPSAFIPNLIVDFLNWWRS